MHSQPLQPARLRGSFSTGHVVRRACLAAAIVVGAIAVTGASDWPEWRGPLRDGHSTETNLPSKWSPSGDNLAWRIPIGSRSSPVASAIALPQHPDGDIANTQERLVALDARNRQGGVGEALQPLFGRCAQAPIVVGVARGRSKPATSTSSPWRRSSSAWRQTARSSGIGRCRRVRSGDHARRRTTSPIVEATRSS